MNIKYSQTNTDFRMPYMQLVNRRLAEFHDTHEGNHSIDDVEEWLNAVVYELGAKQGFYLRHNDLHIRRVELTGTLEKLNIHFYNG